MKPLEFFVVVSLLLLPPFAYAEFDPETLNDFTVVKAAPCYPYQCVQLVKDGKEYLVVLQVRTFIIEFVFLMKGKELELVFAKGMI
ncbi:MAG: hypothetical protein NUW00_05585 [Candidatus Kaiserbacteria bacterium]|nr:hypothetical protein [Candidatus Kaiserbacteria bacterium]